jgi:hypothetical protein
MTANTTDRLPLDALPERVREYVAAVSTATQTPVELAAFAALGTAAGACLGAAEVAVPWGTSPLAFYATVALPSGERKSAVLTRVTAPLRAVEAERREAARPEIAAAEARREVLEGERRRAIQGGDLEAAATAAAELALVPPIVTPRFLVDDVTPERLGTLLADHGQTAVIAAESAFFDNIVGGRYSDRGGNLHLVCQAYMGEATSIDRQGAETRHLPEPLLVLMLCVQPHVLAGLVGDSKARAQGLVARMMLARPPSMVGSRHPDPDPVPHGLTTWWDLAIRAMTRMRSGDRLTIEMSAEAEAIFRTLRETHERRLGTFGDLGGIVDWANRHPDRVARLAALFCLLDGHRVIGAEHMAGAVRMGEYLIGEASTILAEAEAVDVPATKHERAVNMVTTMLSAGPVQPADVRAAAKAEGISWKTIENATGPGGEVPVVKTGGPTSMWALNPATPQTPQHRNAPQTPDGMTVCVDPLGHREHQTPSVDHPGWDVCAVCSEVGA